MKQNRRKYTVLISMVLVFVMMLSLTGCGGYRVGGKALEEVKVEDMDFAETIYERVMVVFKDGIVENLNGISYSSKVTYEDVWAEWESMQEVYGELQSYELDCAYIYGEDTIAIGYLYMENGRIAVDVMIEDSGKIKQIEIYIPAEEEEAGCIMPETVEETAVVLGEGSEYPLDGVITMPKGAQEDGRKYPAVVLIHGTGANDMNMTAGSTEMFRDMAWGLAEQGIISIRYDKRTSVYAEEMESYPSAENLTVEWDIADDAVLATEILRGLECVDSEKVYAAGHSLGGLVMPRIDDNGGNYTGYILMAVPDNTWQEAAFQQFLNYGLANMDSDDVYYACRFLESQKKDIDEKLDTYSESELIEELLLGMPAHYWKNLNAMDYVASYVASEKPMLILQGEEDYQIRADENYEGWKQKLEGHDNVTMHLYEGLNHLFMTSQGCFMGSSMEYTMPNHVDTAVITDIAAFVNQ